MTDIILDEKALEAAYEAVETTYQNYEGKPSGCIANLDSDQQYQLSERYAEAAIKTYLSHASEDDWMDISDEMPEDEFFLIATGDGNVIHSSVLLESTVTNQQVHEVLRDARGWQPLPNPPKGDNK